MSIAREEAERLGLQIERLLTWDFGKGMARRLAEGELPDRILYGLDELEISNKLVARGDQEFPEDIVTCEQTGLPLRPLYIHLPSGRIKRAVPISWGEGVDYYDYRDLAGASK